MVSSAEQHPLFRPGMRIRVFNDPQQTGHQAAVCAIRDQSAGTSGNQEKAFFNNFSCQTTSHEEEGVTGRDKGKKIFHKRIEFLPNSPAGEFCYVSVQTAGAPNRFVAKVVNGELHLFPSCENFAFNKQKKVGRNIFCWCVTDWK